MWELELRLLRFFIWTPCRNDKQTISLHQLVVMNAEVEWLDSFY